MRSRVFMLRNLKEMSRDPLNLCFGLGFPLVLLVLLSAIAKNVPLLPDGTNPTPLFAIDQLTPGVAVFGLSFISLFSGLLISQDRETSFMLRLFTSPMRATDFLLGYTVPLLPMAFLQSAFCVVVAFCFGLKASWSLLVLPVLLLIPALLYIGLGLLAGTLLNTKQVGGLIGALLTNISAWLSGTWFDVALMGKGFKAVADCLPFSHAVEMGRAALAGDYAGIFPHIFWVLGYAVGVMALAIFVFRRRMTGNHV